MTDISTQLCDQVKKAVTDNRPLRITAGNTKSFYGRVISGDVLDVSGHRGIVNYAPTELVLTARAGTQLQEIESTLASQGQMLAFEPPHFGDGATIGGTIACGLSGPRRAYAGAARDFILGSRLINGRGEHLRFGGEVMKNVAGYDVSRLLVGSFGTLGVITEVSMKTLPLPKHERTLVFEFDADTALQKMNEWAGKPLPISATCHTEGHLFVRLSGAENGVKAAVDKLGGEQMTTDPGFWKVLREQQHPYFAGAETLWRISVPAARPMLPLAGAWLLEWGGALRWYRGSAPAAQIRAAVHQAGGHATLFRGGDPNGELFHPLANGVRALHLNLKQAFDPAGIFNRGKMYADI